MKLLDWLVPPRDLSDPADAITTHRLAVAATTLGFVGSSVSLGVELVRAHPLEARIALALALGFASLLLALRLGAHPRWATNAVVALVGGHAAAMAVQSGGTHPSIVVVGIVPPVAILLCGRRAGLGWCAMLGAVLALGASGVIAPPETPDAGGPSAGRHQLQGAFILLAAGVGITLVYERLRERSRLEAEQARREQAASLGRFQALVERTFDGFTILAPGGSLVYLNPWAEAASGYRRDAILGITIDDCTTMLVHPDDVDRVQRAYRECCEAPGRVVSVEARWRHAKHGFRSFEVLAKNMIDDPAIGGVVVNYRDISERRAVEEQQRAADSARERARRLEGLAALAGGTAHRFNNLLTIVLGNTSLLRNASAQDPTAAPLLDEIDAAIARATSITDRMLSYSGAKPRREELLDLGAVVVAAGQRAPTERRIEVDAAPGFTPVAADAAAVEEMIDVLLENAQEALGGEPGRVSLSVGEALFDDEAIASCQIPAPSGAGRYVYFDVSDTGVGIDDAAIDRLFDPFYSTKFEGRGLGLAAVQGICRDAGAAVHVRSAPSAGTTVRVLFPVATAPEANGDGSAGRTVLVVDDEPSVGRVALGLVEQLGVTAEAVLDAPEAMRRLRAQPRRYGLVLLDMTMPGMGGLEAMREIRRFAPELPVVLMSGYRNPELEIGPDPRSRFLRKPFDRNQLRALLRAFELVDRDA